MYPNLIIGGTNKAGTTSVFRYLAAHPSVCASSVKETRYFSHHPSPLTPDSLREYGAYFKHCKNDCSIILEASPQYLAGGKVVARRIRTVIPNVRLVFLLREPADRLMSFYNSYVSQAHPIVHNLSPEDFVEKSLATDGLSQEVLCRRDRQLQHELYRGHYHPLLADYLSVIRADQMLILFFDELTVDPKSLMRKICAFAAIDEGFYADFDFSVENKTRRYRSTFLNRTAHAVNLRLEPVFNRIPALRSALRRIYTTVNERKQDEVNHSAAINRLSAYYEPQCKELGKLLRCAWPEMQLPLWLTP